MGHRTVGRLVGRVRDDRRGGAALSMSHRGRNPTTKDGARREYRVGHRLGQALRLILIEILGMQCIPKIIMIATISMGSSSPRRDEGPRRGGR